VSAVEVVVDGLAFPECPRWHDGALWFSDQHDRKVLRVDVSSGAVTTVCEVDHQPSGLGWLPDGDLLVVSMHDRRLLRLRADGELVEHADLSRVASFHCNDMVVDSSGRAYVGNFGFDFETRGAEFVAAAIALVDPDGAVRVAADGLAFPNGSVITPDGATFIVGESFGGAISAFAIAVDGTLHDRREYARVEGAVPDGICLDAEGAVWFADPIGGDVIRVREGGEVTDRLAVGDGRKAYACMLGGPERRTLFVCAATTYASAETRRGERMGRVVAVDVESPGAGLP
jgi:sugar lactone lactonase YvrE